MTQKNTEPLNGTNSHDESLSAEQAARIAQVGAQASQALQNPVFNTVYHHLLNKKFQDWLTTSPKEEKKRESLYYEAAGLMEITNQLGVAVEDALRLEREQAERHSATRVEQDFMDQQGFGLNLN